MKQYIIILLVSMLSACASNKIDQQTRYYQLPESAFRAPAQRASELALQIVLAEPLANEHLLYQSDDHHLNFAQRNLWAAPLTDALAANLTNKLNQLSHHHAYLPQRHARADAPIIKVYLDRFQGTYRGETHISGYAQWANGTRIPFSVHTPQYGDGYDAMLLSLNQGLGEVARIIIQP